jgi:UDP-N-acetylmuramoyl-L-alanyl-D-glutamate--2,6-diaminopimelate ligase
MIAESGKSDVVLIAGKGHETYQEVAGKRSHFSDEEQARAALAQRDKAGRRG